MQWYQPLDRHEGYRTMVNSHLTWLVEFGWPLRFLYLAAWAAVFCLCWPSQQNRFFQSVCFGCWLSLAVACVFSSVGESPWVWVIPGIALASTLVIRWQYKYWSPVRFLFGVMGISWILTVGIYLLGLMTSQRLVRYKDDMVFLGSEPVRVWIILDESIFGKYFGSNLRRAFADRVEKRGIVISRRLPECPVLEKRALLVVARLNDDQAVSETLKTWLQSRNELLLINPWTYPTSLPIGSLNQGTVEVWQGRFSDSPSADIWSKEQNVRLNVFGRKFFKRMV